MLRSFNQFLCFFFLFLALDNKFYNGSNMTTLLLQKAKITANLEKILFPNKRQKRISHRLKTPPLYWGDSVTSFDCNTSKYASKSVKINPSAKVLLKC